MEVNSPLRLHMTPHLPTFKEAKVVAKLKVPFLSLNDEPLLKRTKVWLQWEGGHNEVLKKNSLLVSFKHTLIDKVVFPSLLERALSFTASSLADVQF